MAHSDTTAAPLTADQVIRDTHVIRAAWITLVIGTLVTCVLNVAGAHMAGTTTYAGYSVHAVVPLTVLGISVLFEIVALAPTIDRWLKVPVTILLAGFFLTVLTYSYAGVMTWFEYAIPIYEIVNDSGEVIRTATAPGSKADVAGLLVMETGWLEYPRYALAAIPDGVMIAAAAVILNRRIRLSRMAGVTPVAVKADTAKPSRWSRIADAAVNRFENALSDKPDAAVTPPVMAPVPAPPMAPMAPVPAYSVAPPMTPVTPQVAAGVTADDTAPEVSMTVDDTAPITVTDTRETVNRTPVEPVTDTVQAVTDTAAEPVNGTDSAADDTTSHVSLTAEQRAEAVMMKRVADVSVSVEKVAVIIAALRESGGRQAHAAGRAGTSRGPVKKILDVMTARGEFGGDTAESATTANTERVEEPSLV